MNMEKKSKYWVVHEASIEFVLIGPKKSGSGILVRSDNMKPDLLGYAIEQREKDKKKDDDKDEDFRPSFLRLFFAVILILSTLFRPRPRKLNVLRIETFDFKSPEDERDATLLLAWVGDSSWHMREMARLAMSRFSADLRAGLREDDEARIEWSIAPVLYELLKKDHVERQLRFIHMYFSLIILSLILTFIAWLIAKLAHIGNV